MNTAPLLDLIPAAVEHRPLLRRLFELYIYDFSPMTGSDIKPDGWWSDESFLAEWPERGPDIYLFRVDGHWAGFAWVGRGSYVEPGGPARTLMEEFFIMRKYRGRGLGERFARQLFERYPGTWEVSEIPENTEALAFWRKVIGRYTGGRYQDLVADNEHWKGPVQVFDAQAVAQEK